MGNIVLFMEKHTEAMERIMMELCPDNVDLRFLYPCFGKKGEIKEADILLPAGSKVSREVLAEAKKCRMIQTAGVAFNNVDLQAATERGVVVCNAAGQNAISVAEMTIAMMLSCLRRIPMIDQCVKKGEWHKFTYRHDSYEIFGKTIGIFGGGAIGRSVMERLDGWGVNLIYYDPFRMLPELEQQLKVKYVDMDTLFRESDVISLHCPLTEETKGVVNKEKLKMMKKSAIIINESRGAIINMDDLVEALEEEEIWGAAIDVWETEPVDPHHPLLKMKKVITTSHLGGSTREAMQRIYGMSLENASHFLKGEKPINIRN